MVFERIIGDKEGIEFFNRTLHPYTLSPTTPYYSTKIILNHLKPLQRRVVPNGKKSMSKIMAESDLVVFRGVARGEFSGRGEHAPQGKFWISGAWKRDFSPSDMSFCANLPS